MIFFSINSIKWKQTWRIKKVPIEFSLWNAMTCNQIIVYGQWFFWGQNPIICRALWEVLLPPIRGNKWEYGSEKFTVYWICKLLDFPFFSISRYLVLNKVNKIKLICIPYSVLYRQSLLIRRKTLCISW